MQNFEQMMNLYHGIFVGCGIAALVFLALAVVTFILLKIPGVFAELSGRTAKKAIQEMENNSAQSGNLGSRKIGEDGRRQRNARGRTGTLGTSKLRRRTGGLNNSAANSGSLVTGKMNQPVDVQENIMSSQPSMEQTPLQVKDNTEYRGDEATGILDSGAEATNVLNMDADVSNEINADEKSTEILEAAMKAPDTEDTDNAESETVVLSQTVNVAGFRILRSVVMVHAKGVE